jgi:hypothetical protein
VGAERNMHRIAKLEVCSLLVATMLVAASVLEAQSPKDSAPIPIQILSAKKVLFLTLGRMV